MPTKPETRRELYAKNVIAKRAPQPTQRRHCTNCDALFDKNPRRDDHQFCSPKCRKDFHRNGTAMGPVLKRIEAIVHAQIDTRTADVAKLLESCQAIALSLDSLRKRIERLRKSIGNAHQPKRQSAKARRNT
jgi:hypothetical protein